MRQIESRSSRFDSVAASQLNPLYNYAFWMTQDPEHSSELVRQAYGQACATRCDGLVEDEIKVLLFRIMRRLIIRHRDRKGRDRVLADRHHRETHPNGGVETRRELHEPADQRLSSLIESIIRNSIRTMSEEFASAILLCELEGLPYAEIARIMNCSVREVGKRIQEGQRVLRGELGGYVRMIVHGTRYVPAHYNYAWS